MEKKLLQKWRFLGGHFLGNKKLKSGFLNGEASKSGGFFSMGFFASRNTMVMLDFEYFHFLMSKRPRRDRFAHNSVRKRFWA